MRCCICLDGNHRTRYCPHIFNGVWERMRICDKEIRSKKILAERGGFVSKNNAEGNKNHKISVLSKDEIVKKFSELFYIEGDSIRFCTMEKYAIRTK